MVAQGTDAHGKRDNHANYLPDPLIAAAHELKAPLALIRQLSMFLQTSTLSQAEVERYISQITLTSERALRLTSDLTRSVRLQDSLFELEPLNPKVLCEDVAHQLSPLFSAQSCDLRVAPRSRPLLMVGNRELVQRILTNFCDNALHYASGSKVVELTIVEKHEGQTVRLGVRDYGPTLPADAFRVLSERLSSFQALHSRPQSSGLGLMLASQFAEIMNSKIGATRHRDGATFYIDTPTSRQLALI